MIHPALISQYPLEFPAVWDSTMLSDAKCRRRFFLRHVIGLRSRGTGIHLHAGGVFAKAMEETRRCFYEDGFPSEYAIEYGLRELLLKWGEYDPEGYGTTKSLERLCEAFVKYWIRWPLETDPFRPAVMANSKSCIEFNFGVPLPINHPVTKEPLLFAGRFDMLAQTPEGAYYGVDEKTSSQLGATWSAQWDLRAQFKAYAWGSRQYGFPVRDFIVRGVCLRKHDVDYAEAIIPCSDHMLDEWLDMALMTITDSIRCWESGHYIMDMNELCNSYGGCSFKRLCLLEDPTPFVDPYFEVQRWNPLEGPVDG